MKKRQINDDHTDIGKYPGEKVEDVKMYQMTGLQ